MENDKKLIEVSQNEKDTIDINEKIIEIRKELENLKDQGAYPQFGI